MERKAENNERPRDATENPHSTGIQRVLESMAEFRDDPFKGSVERRVLADALAPSDMEILAGKDALQRAGVPADEIDLLMVYSQLPDYLTVSTAVRVHEGLGLPARCFTTSVESACNSFMQQLEMASLMIESGRVKRALLIQSTAISRAVRPEDQHSVWFGDCATAVVVGPVSEGRGLLGTAHRTDGSFYRALVTGCPGKHWWEGHPFVYNEDSAAARRMLLAIADVGKEVVDDALGQIGMAADQVDFYATHQSTLWFRKVTQEHLGLTHAQSFDTFRWTASVAACSVPLMMGMGEREGVLRDGHTVAMYSGGGGITYSGAILRWGK
jgi:3-oxoacyl-[acyl-carrier-protein] synthase-3